MSTSTGMPSTSNLGNAADTSSSHSLYAATTYGLKLHLLEHQSSSLSLTRLEAGSISSISMEEETDKKLDEKVITTHSETNYQTMTTNSKARRYIPWGLFSFLKEQLVNDVCL
jgi:hypothetical protein